MRQVVAIGLFIRNGTLHFYFNEQNQTQNYQYYQEVRNPITKKSPERWLNNWISVKIVIHRISTNIDSIENVEAEGIRIIIKLPHDSIKRYLTTMFA